MAAATRIRSVCTDLGEHPKDCFEAKPGVSGPSLCLRSRVCM